MGRGLDEADEDESDIDVAEREADEDAHAEMPFGRLDFLRDGSAA